MTDPAWQREAILTALERLLAWPEIARSPQLGRFLDYIVQRTLEGNEASIKAYSIAVDVFGRAADFDPQADPIVRVQARRLRALLDDYYRGPGLGEATQIRLPVGRYIPEFVAPSDPGEAEANEERQVPSRPGWPGAWSFSASWFTLAVIALVVAMSAYAVMAWRTQMGEDGAIGAMQRPSITIVEFQDLAASAASPPQVAGLAIELVTDLEQFGNIAARYGGSGEASVPAPVAPASDYVLTGIVRPDGDVVQYSAILTDSATSTVVWNQTLSVRVEEALQPGVLDRVSRSLSLVLGSPRGPLHVAARQLLASSTPLDGRFNAYLCRVLFDLYRETGDVAEAARASACYASLPEDDRNSARVLAAMASLSVEWAGPEAAGTPAERLQQATADLQRAIELDPVSGFVWEQQARLHEGQGDLVTARADFSSAVQLNGASVDALAAYARLLALGGNLSEAEAMARDAAEGSPNPPPWYQGVPALLALRDGDLAAAIAAAELYARADRELGPILAIMAAQRAGDGDVVNRYLPQVLDVAAFRVAGVLPRLRQRIADVVLMDTIRAALVRAGVPPAALTGPF